jgi:hypothetical protein
MLLDPQLIILEKQCLSFAQTIGNRKIMTKNYFKKNHEKNHW